MIKGTEQGTTETDNQNQTSYRELLEALKNKNLQDDSLNPFLKLAPPVSAQNNIEFNQVFRLQPSEAFYSLYRQCYQSGNPDLATSRLTKKDKYLANHVRLIDRRPLRWYRTLEAISRDMSELSYNREITLASLKVQKESIKKSAEEYPAGPKRPEQIAIERRYREELQKLKKIEQSLEQYKQVKRKMIVEITAAGYIYDENTVAKQKAGAKEKEPAYRLNLEGESSHRAFNFQISKPVAEKPAPPPLDNPEKFTPMDDDNWKKLLAQLTAAVIDNKLITSEDKVSSFKQGSQELASIGSCNLIQSELKSLQDTIATIDGEASQAQADSQEILKKAQTTCDNLVASYQREIEYRNNLYLQGVYIVRHPQKSGSLSKDIENAIIAASPETDVRFVSALDKWLTDVNFPYTSAALKQQIINFTDLQNKAKANKQSVESDNQKDTATKLADCDQRKKSAQASLDGYDASKVLSQERIKFLLFWNNPQVYDNKLTQVNIQPGFDPLQDFYNEINRTNVNQGNIYKIHQFNFDGTGYFDQEGRSLEEFMKLPNLSTQVAIFPAIDQNGQPSRELMRAIIGPRQSHAKLNMPDIKFVETQELNVSWQRYALGALASAINLAPGEQKQIVVTKETKLTRQVSESRSESTEQRRNMTSSFEENLSSELSTSYNRSDSDNTTTDVKQEQKNSDSSSNGRDRSNTDKSSEKAHASGSFFDKAFDVSADVESSSEETDRTIQTRTIEAAIALSQSKNVQVMSSLSRQISAKNVDNRVQKVATDTSLNNKVDVTSSSSEQLEENTSNQEMMKLTNPNDGRSITYNLFQMQNVYSVHTELKNIQLVVNTGRELAEGSGIYETKVYELEQFNRIFNDSKKSDFEILTCALVARKVLKNYTDLLQEAPKNQDIIRLRIKEGENSALKIAEIAMLYRKLNLATSIANPTPSPTGLSAAVVDEKLKNKIVALRSALSRLHQFTFVCVDRHVISRREFTVNAPAYYMDSQLGLLPATEPYLEQRRQLALEEKSNFNDLLRAEADYLRNSKPANPTPPPAGTVSQAPAHLAFLGGKPAAKPAADQQLPTEPVKELGLGQK